MTLGSRKTRRTAPLTETLCGRGDVDIITIRKATPKDAEAACAVLARSITEICAPYYGNDEEVLAQWLENKTPANVRRWIESDLSYCVVAVNDKGLVVRLCQHFPLGDHAELYFTRGIASRCWQGNASSVRDSSDRLRYRAHRCGEHYPGQSLLRAKRLCFKWRSEARRPHRW